MFDSVADWMAVPLLHYEHLGHETRRLGLSHASIYPYSAYNCVDGRIVIAIQNQDEWQRFCQTVLERSDIIDASQFMDNKSRVANRVALDEIINEVISPLTRDQAVARCVAAGVAYGNVSTIRDLAKHPALRRVTVELPEGEFECVAPPLHPNLKPGPVPGIGENTDQVRQEFAEQSPS